MTVYHCPHTKDTCWRGCGFDGLRQQVQCANRRDAEARLQGLHEAASGLRHCPSSGKDCTQGCVRICQDLAGQTAKPAPVLVMRETNLKDVAATLRKLADSIEAAGGASACVVVWEGGSEGLQVSYCGEGEAAPNAHLLLHAGAHKMMSAGRKV